MEISFGAKLLTLPQQFVHKIDTPQQQLQAEKFLRCLKHFVENPVFDKFTKNDTIELQRTFSKKGHFSYKIIYKSPEITNTDAFEHINMSAGDELGIGEVFCAFKQISYAPMYKNGAFSKNYPLFDTYNDGFRRTFKMDVNDFLKTLGQKDNS